MELLTGLIVFFASVTAFCFLYLWTISPLLSSRDSSQYRRFILTDLYTLVLQIGIVGMWLRSAFPSDDDRFLRIFGCCALFLALIWRFIVAALDDHGVRANQKRIPVLIIAPIHLLACPSFCFLGVMALGADKLSLAPAIFLACGSLLPVLFRSIYRWAITSSKNAGDEAPASSKN